MNFTDGPVPMRGESKTDRQIVLGILRATAAHLNKRGIKSYKTGEREVIVDEICWRATYGNRCSESGEDEEWLVNDAYHALGEVGWFTSLDGEELQRSAGLASIPMRREEHIAAGAAAPALELGRRWPFRIIELGLSCDPHTQHLVILFLDAW